MSRRTQWLGALLVGPLLAAACGDNGGGADTDTTQADDTPADDESKSITGDLTEDEFIATEGDDTPGASAQNECARDTFEAERVPVNLHLVVDISGSMAAPVGPESTRWDAVRDAVGQFINAEESAGLNLALSYYPAQAPREVCTSHAQCAASPCFTHVCAVELLLGLPTYCEPSRFNQQDPASCELALVDEDGDLFVRAADDVAPNDDVVASQLCLPSGFCSNAATSFCLVDEDCPGGTCEVSPTDGICSGANSCDIADYSEPSVPIGSLPMSAMALVDSLAAIEPDPFALTPTHVALAGAYTHSAAWLESDPSAKTVIVLATDGFPEGCPLVNLLGREVASAPQLTLEELARGQAAGMDTFVIGVVDDGQDVGGEGRQALGQMAQAGGTEEALIVTADDTTADGFLAALDKVRGAVLPCEYQIPTPDEGVANLAQLNIDVTRNGKTETAPKVESQGACAAGELGWHYDAEGDASNKIVLCPETCAELNAEPGTQLDVVLGCATVTRVK